MLHEVVMTQHRENGRKSCANIVVTDSLLDIINLPYLSFQSLYLISIDSLILL